MDEQRVFRLRSLSSETRGAITRTLVSKIRNALIDGPENRGDDAENLPRTEKKNHVLRPSVAIPGNDLSVRLICQRKIISRQAIKQDETIEV